MTFVCERTFAARLHAGFFLFLSWWFRLSLRRSTSGEPHWRCGAPKGVAGSNPVSHPWQVPGSATTGGLRRCRTAHHHLPFVSRQTLTVHLEYGYEHDVGEQRTVLLRTRGGKTPRREQMSCSSAHSGQGTPHRENRQYLAGPRERSQETGTRRTATWAS